MIVETEYGRIEGVEVDGLSVIRNIPYAAPPFGERRFRPPVPPEKWDGVRDGTVSGPSAPQPIDDETRSINYFNPERWGEDCLTLEVWTPDTSGSAPVMVWIHGGGFMFGVGSAPGHSGRTFARDGIVHVAINYRLGVEGFLPLPDGGDNLGLRDQVAALEWVQRNIASFGGDPDNVTIFGESGGAVGVMHVLAMPSARGLFQRAIAQSGSPFASVSLAEQEKKTRQFAKRLGVPATREGLGTVSPEKAAAEAFRFSIEFISNPIANGSSSFMLSPFRAAFDSPSLPLSPVDAARAEEGVPLMTGTNRNESYEFANMLNAPGFQARLVSGLAQLMMAGVGRIGRSYREGPRKIPKGFRLLEAIWSDWSFRIPTIRLVEARRARTHLYEFRWESPSLPKGVGSIHTIEIPFVRDDFVSVLDAGAWGEALVGTNPPAALATAMHGAWVSYARTGDPGWPAYELDTRSTMLFDEHSEVVDDPAAVERKAWEGRR